MNEILWSNIKSLLEERGETVAHLERKMGWGVSSISKWKTSTPSLEKVLKVSEYFGVTVDVLTYLSLTPKRLQNEYIGSTLVFLLIHDKVLPVFDKDTFTCSVGDFQISYTYDDDNFSIITGDNKRSVPLYDTDKYTLCVWMRRGQRDPVLNKLQDELRMLVNP